MGFAIVQLLLGVILADASPLLRDDVDVVKQMLTRIAPSHDLGSLIDLKIMPLPADLAAKGELGFFALSPPQAASSASVEISGTNGVDLASGVHWYLKVREL
jgi:hypothetical protein